MSRIKLFLLSISFGVLMWLAWTPKPFAPLLLIAFIPLLIVERTLSKKYPNAGAKVFGYSYLAFLSWNLLTTWWIANTYEGTQEFSSVLGGLFPNVANPLLMCFPFLFFHFTKKRLGNIIGYASLPAYWIAFEYFHLRWELSWPWLTLGNGFAQYPILIQWYEYTGVLGGSLWILVTNILLFRFFFSANENESKKSFWKRAIPVALIILIPIVTSIVIESNYLGLVPIIKKVTKRIVVVQPNIDPYNEKFDFTTLDEQLNKLLKLSASKVDNNTDYLVWPETAIPQGIWLNEIDSDKTILKIRSFLKNYPRLKLVTGMSAYQQYVSAETLTARYFADGECCYDAFNSAVQIDSSRLFQIYHKSKLVPGVERIPYQNLFGFLKSLTLDMGGISGSLAVQEHRSVFFSSDSVGIAPVICYESVFGDYCTEYVKRGANFFFIVTNDGWWGNTAGHLQHLSYASLLAIETRRCIARSANTGTSGFIDEMGNISQRTDWWQPAVIETSLPLNSKLTFYVRFGDYIGKMAIAFSILFFIWLTIRRFRK